jgi:hypothetical protein
METTKQLRRILRLKQAAEYCGITAWTLRRVVRAGGIQYIQHGQAGPFFFDLRDLDAYLDGAKKTAQPTS